MSRPDQGAEVDQQSETSARVSFALTSSSAAHGLAQTLENWRNRLASAGVGCRAVAIYSSASVEWNVAFAVADAHLNDIWAGLCTKGATSGSAVSLRLSDTAASDVLLACPMQLTVEAVALVGVVLSPPHNERTVQIVLLAVDALQLTLSPVTGGGPQRASVMLELLGYVGSQRSARAAAQEWVNRTAAWMRAQAPTARAQASLMLFQVHASRPRWWVSSDIAWVETESSAVQQAGELAARAAIEARDVAHHNSVAMPILCDGAVVAVLIARFGDDQAAVVANPQDLKMLRASIGLAEPLLRHWREADRSLMRHVLDSMRNGWSDLWGPGHLTWKLGVGAGVLTLVVLTCIPVIDRVTANTVIEGKLRQVITTPFDGFIAQALIRPGDRVIAGQVLARLDDRELKLDLAKQRSERDQAAGKLRQAMSERDAAQVALTSAELRQAEAQLALVEAKLARSVLVAPMAGLVVSGDWVQHIGGPVEAGKEMFEIASADGYRVVLHVPDRDIARVNPGQGGQLRLTGQPQVTHEFEVKVVTATASVQEGVNGFRVEAAWKGEPPSLSPGMQGVGKVEVGRASLLQIWTKSSLDWLRLKLWAWWW